MGREQRRNLEAVWGKHRVGELGARSTGKGKSGRGQQHPEADAAFGWM